MKFDAEFPTLMRFGLSNVKEENILKGSLDLIPTPSPLVKI